jgi:hypothetical protein
MSDFQSNRDKLEAKLFNNPTSVTKDDLKSYEAFYALKTYFWKNQESSKEIFGDYEVEHVFRRGIRSNSGKSKTPTQHMFIINNLTNDEQWENGYIFIEHNRRSRFGNTAQENRELYTQSMNQFKETN